MCDRKSGGLGLMVLRLLQGTGIPGVLVECGYLNHSRDRAKLLDDGYRKKVADGIVSGLKAYIEGTPF
jgi:N-acetylmuramoyl-L-alanine amidase